MANRFVIPNKSREGSLIFALHRIQSQSYKPQHVCTLPSHFKHYFQAHLHLGTWQTWSQFPCNKIRPCIQFVCSGNLDGNLKLGHPLTRVECNLNASRPQMWISKCVTYLKLTKTTSKQTGWVEATNAIPSYL